MSAFSLSGRDGLVAGLGSAAAAGVLLLAGMLTGKGGLDNSDRTVNVNNSGDGTVNVSVPGPDVSCPLVWRETGRGPAPEEGFGGYVSCSNGDYILRLSPGAEPKLYRHIANADGPVGEVTDPAEVARIVGQ